MRLNAIILVTGLLAFANADLVARKDIDYNKGAPESHGVIGKAGDDACVALGCDSSLPACLEHLLRSTIVKSAGPLSTRANRTAAVTRLAKQHVVVPSPTRIAVTSARLPPVLPLLKQQTPMTPSHPQLTIAKSAGPPSTPVNKTAMVTRHARQGAYALALSGKAAASASPSIVRALRVKRPLMFLRYGRP
ncbi:unnamed protein product [Alternaria alternata]